jgi:phosphatidylglycerophosphate synthase
MGLDYFDGATFDKSNFSGLKEWRIKRRIADSVSDRLVIQIVCIPIFLKTPSFAWLYIPILVRELTISGYVAHQFSKRIVLYPRAICKLACAMVGIAVISFINFSSWATFPLAIAMVALSAGALLNYHRRASAHHNSNTGIDPSGTMREII